MPKWTSDQRAAIEASGSAVLVSAAAGSGKTAVIVARVLQKLMDTNDPMNIDELLLVTFTNAAAAEMRERISAAISDEVAKNPGHVHLRRQLLLVQRAQIKTVHALCLQIVQENTMALGISPDFRLMDERERSILYAEVLEDTMDAAYEEADDAFAALIDLMLSGKDDKRLADTVRHVYEKIQAHAWPEAFLEEMRASLYQGDMQTPAARVLLSQAEAAAAHGASFLRLAIDEMQCVPELEETYLPVFQNDLRQAEGLLSALQGGDWDASVLAAQAVSMDRLKAARGYEDKEFLEKMKAYREEWKKAQKQITEKWLTVLQCDAVADRAHVAPALSALIRLVLAFSENVQAEKKKRSLLDFGDLEHYAIALLYTNGKPSTLAQTLSTQYREIMVDEYQDTNAVQDTIFKALSKQENNLFMVGDVKQSIYGFRLADPGIFLQKYKAYANATTAAPGDPRRIILGQNFRSRAAVLDAANFIFARTMGERVGDLQYTDREALHLGAQYPEPYDARYKTEVLVLDAKTEDADDTREKADMEATLVARRIRALLDEGFLVTDKETQALRPARAEDIVILMRSPKAKAKAYLHALEAVGLSGSADETGGLLETVEVDTMVSFLMILDNPRQDIPLIGVLRSPLFAFGEEELAEIRLIDRGAAFYDALLVFAQTSDKAAAFLALFLELRALAQDVPVFTLLGTIYEKTGALALYGALPRGEMRQANLLAFLERTRAFEAQGYKGLFSYVRLLRGMQENGDDFERVVSKEQGGTVRIMSIHKSKGLEFPIVIVADLAKRFNESDLKEPILVHSKLGLGSKCKDNARGIQYNTAERVAITLAQRKEMVSEEIRILYVALTRAREKLILSASSSNLVSNLKKWANYASVTPIPQYAMGEMRDALGWVMTALLRHPASRALKEAYGMVTSEEGNAPDVFEIICCSREMLQENGVAASVRSFEERTAEELAVLPEPFVYPYRAMADLPSKVTATGLDRGYRAEEAAEWTGRKRAHEKALRTPTFVRAEKKLRPTEVGTAHHLFLQFCDFETASKPLGIKQEIARLRDASILSEEAADALSEQKLSAFFSSDLFQKRFKAATVRREFKFSVLVPAVWAFPASDAQSEEEVLLQGVIDCLLEDADGFTIVDFKTDAVSGAALAARARSYEAQLDAYAMATQRIFGKPVREKILFFLHAGETFVFAA